jgi:hypothetical protein
MQSERRTRLDADGTAPGQPHRVRRRQREQYPASDPESSESFTGHQDKSQKKRSGLRTPRSRSREIRAQTRIALTVDNRQKPLSDVQKFLSFFGFL